MFCLLSWYKICKFRRYFWNKDMRNSFHCSPLLILFKKLQLLIAVYIHLTRHFFYFMIYQTDRNILNKKFFNDKNKNGKVPSKKLFKVLSWIHTNDSSIFSSLSRMRIFIFRPHKQKCACEKVKYACNKAIKKRLGSSLNSALMLWSNCNPSMSLTLADGFTVITLLQ